MGAIPQAPSRRSAHARRLFEGLPSTYDRMGAVLSFGQDPRWRRFLVSRLDVGPGANVLDVATGTAMVAREVVVATGARAVGLDLSPDMLRRGVAETAAAGMGDRVRFLQGDGQRLPFGDETFDALTFTYLLRYVDDPAATLAELVRVVRPGGTVAGLEFHVPKPPWSWAWWCYTRLAMPVVGRLVSRDWYAVGRFLGPNISAFYDHLPLTEQFAMWRSAGVPDVQARIMSLGGAVVVWGRRSHGG
jgi:demethylmenaquinone methyltransferase / 2-methoxy-6-polyprenyl-1,4-benzoquinol methylase